MAKRGYDVPGPWDKRGEGLRVPDWDKQFKAEGKALAKLEKESETALEKGNLVGTLIWFGVGDGNAIYRIEKLKPLTLAHVPFGDNWHIPEAHLRGLTLDDVKNFHKFREIFKRV